MVLLAAVGVQPSVVAEPTGDQSAASPEVYTPGLGDIMGAIQVRHAKLWFAGKSKNWELAAYELDEINEGFADAARFQPDFKGHPIAKLVKDITTAPISGLQAAIAAQSAVQFAKAFNRLTAACNSCHRENGFAFISIQRPTAPPFTNQRFEP
ncbi:hypothetical protein [uncultured Thiodictyon sp.]|uniref:hypothetical protein n=1 Tax=uncultured Thiodictyon sp. TaxID=1846217 RepID=UPI0025D37F3F|nr:hypothetical protein [uncultured Thiodictyon sp.]